LGKQVRKIQFARCDKGWTHYLFISAYFLVIWAANRPAGRCNRYFSAGKILADSSVAKWNPVCFQVVGWPVAPNEATKDRFFANHREQSYKKDLHMATWLESGHYYGRVLDKTLLKGMILTESSYAPHCELPRHCHENFYISYVVNGAYEESYGRKTLDCQKGDLIVHPSGFEHGNVFQKAGGRCFNVEIKEWPGNEDFVKDSAYQKLQTPALGSVMGHLYREFRLGDGFSPLIIEGLLYELVGLLGRASSGVGPYWLKKADAIVRESCSPVSLSEMAAFLQVSASHLAREFKKANGVTFGEYVRQIRIQQASEMLLHTNADILTVALHYGFADQSHFTRAFKEVMRLTPLQFRKMNRSG
jgi:AraC family transcriptional regulator